MTIFLSSVKTMTRKALIVSMGFKLICGPTANPRPGATGGPWY